MDLTAKRIDELDRLIRRLRRDPRLWDADGRLGRTLRKALEHRATLRPAAQQAVGHYSGLTRQELRQSGTCETDWA
jgi:hypothetical protein